MKIIPVLFFLVLSSLTAWSQSTALLKKTAVSLLSTLGEVERAQVQLGLEDSARTAWTNLPLGLAPRVGLRYGDLSEESKIAFHKVLSAVFSSQGYLKTFAIMQVDDILHELFEIQFQQGKVNERSMEFIRKLNWDYGNYYLAMAGNPETDDAWGLKFEGHHISINLTVAGDEFTMTPLFFGSDPAVVETTQYAGLRPLSKEEDYGFWLINALDESQKAKATISDKVPGDIITSPDRPQWLEEFQGIKGAELSGGQQKILHYLIEEYIGNLEKEKAEAYLEKLHTRGMDEVYFAWIGSYEPMKAHYYVIHSPDFLIEYDNVGFLDNANHIHTILREKGNDFGEDILKKHRLDHKH
ncbi:MAG: DUF3500 domain-containing protein [Algoriphagus sp.]|uniref:DUF3500 domain-containing protein n=1 Tax=Algoriphagus sp. TaxID=1872435 RepID=UPI002731518B|nr:DUF3500 domain-containing protein [Algoriphagus sp.]MDP2040252.1 DUF3500 domain-containing protein [Algoriphagus sp.]MDP3471358.1 DUF3500 domain-containing protein [Algoriphagus sp.]